jgi:hypothetical protein
VTTAEHDPQSTESSLEPIGDSQAVSVIAPSTDALLLVPTFLALTFCANKFPAEITLKSINKAMVLRFMIFFLPFSIFFQICQGQGQLTQRSLLKIRYFTEAPI